LINIQSDILVVQTIQQNSFPLSFSKNHLWLSTWNIWIAMCDSLSHHGFLRTLTVVWCALDFPLNSESKSQLHNYKGCCKLILVLYAYVIRMLVLNILTFFFLSLVFPFNIWLSWYDFATLLLCSLYCNSYSMYLQEFNRETRFTSRFWSK